MAGCVEGNNGNQTTITFQFNDLSIERRFDLATFQLGIICLSYLFLLVALSAENAIGRVGIFFFQS